MFGIVFVVGIIWVLNVIFDNIGFVENFVNFLVGIGVIIIVLVILIVLGILVGFIFVIRVI